MRSGLAGPEYPKSAGLSRSRTSALPNLSRWTLGNKSLGRSKRSGNAWLDGVDQSGLGRAAVGSAPRLQPSCARRDSQEKRCERSHLLQVSSGKRSIDVFDQRHVTVAGIDKHFVHHTCQQQHGSTTLVSKALWCARQGSVCDRWPIAIA